MSLFKRKSADPRRAKWEKALVMYEKGKLNNVDEMLFDYYTKAIADGHFQFFLDAGDRIAAYGETLARILPEKFAATYKKAFNAYIRHDSTESVCAEADDFLIENQVEFGEYMLEYANMMR